MMMERLASIKCKTINFPEVEMLRATTERTGTMRCDINRKFISHSDRSKRKGIINRIQG